MLDIRVTCDVSVGSQKKIYASETCWKGWKLNIYYISYHLPVYN